VAKAFAYLIVGLRFPLILGWATAVVAAVLFLPPLSSSGGLSDLIPAGSPAAQADASATQLFGYPLEAGIAIVQSHPHDLPQAVVDKTAQAAVRYDHRAGVPGLLAVIPIPNGVGIPRAITVSPASAAGLGRRPLPTAAWRMPCADSRAWQTLSGRRYLPAPLRPVLRPIRWLPRTGRPFGSRLSTTATR
jgi:hypothetical protein